MTCWSASVCSIRSADCGHLKLKKAAESDDPAFETVWRLPPYSVTVVSAGVSVDFRISV